MGKGRAGGGMHTHILIVQVFTNCAGTMVHGNDCKHTTPYATHMHGIKNNIISQTVKGGEWHRREC